jgi:hypothetical protein
MGLDTLAGACGTGSLLDGGFYDFALHDAFNAPLWMDE